MKITNLLCLGVFKMNYMIVANRGLEDYLLCRYRVYNRCGRGFFITLDEAITYLEGFYNWLDFGGF